jgi:putative transposase
MKKSRFTETQIVAILKQADAGMPVKELWGRPESANRPITTGSRSTAASSDLKRTKELGAELSQLKKAIRRSALQWRR